MLVQTAGYYLRIACELGLLAFLIYTMLLFLRGTRAMTILAGITVVIIGMNFLAQALDLEVIKWILDKLTTFLALSVLIIFQPEIRRAFAQIGSPPPQLHRQHGPRRDREIVSALVESTLFLAERRIGALIAVH